MVLGSLGRWWALMLDRRAFASAWAVWVVLEGHWSWWVVMLFCRLVLA